MRAICLDLFGTLIHFGDGGPNPYRHFLEAIPKGERLPFMTVNRSVQDWANVLGIPERAEQVQYEVDAILTKLNWYPEVPEFLDRVVAKGRRVSWCSNLAPAYGPACRTLLSSLPVEWVGQHFSYEMGTKKPESAMYNGVVEGLGVPASEILFVGDSWKNDVHGPKNHGMAAWHLKRQEGYSLLDLPLLAKEQE